MSKLSLSRRGKAASVAAAVSETANDQLRKAEHLAEGEVLMVEPPARAAPQEALQEPGTAAPDAAAADQTESLDKGWDDVVSDDVVSPPPHKKSKGPPASAARPSTERPSSGRNPRRAAASKAAQQVVPGDLLDVDEASGGDSPSRQGAPRLALASRRCGALSRSSPRASKSTPWARAPGSETDGSAFSASEEDSDSDSDFSADDSGARCSAAAREPPSGRMPLHTSAQAPPPLISAAVPRLRCR